MIEKLKTINPYDETEIDMDTNSVAGLVYENTPLVQKLNELVDAVNELQKDYDNVCIWVGEQKLKTPADNSEKANCQENVLTKSLRMDKEFAEDECVRLQKELNYTQKALGVAFDALNTIKPKKDVSQGGFWTLSQSDILDVILRAEKEIKRITKGGDNE